MKITVCTQKNRWFYKFINDFKEKIKNKNNILNIVFDNKNITKSDICFLISFGKVLTKKQLLKSKFNIVFHCSNLPKGRGSTPITWEILSNKNFLTLTTFDANEDLDTGEIIHKNKIYLNGSELLNEIHEKVYKAILKSSIKVLKSYPNIKKYKQVGKPTYYNKRYKINNKVKINSTIKDIFNLLRVADNEKYPVHFNYKKQTYKLTIDKMKNEKN